MFGGGGAPSVESVIKDQFAKQKKFIEAQFKQQEKVMEKLLGQNELQSVKAKALGVLDALDTRYESFAILVDFPKRVKMAQFYTQGMNSSQLMKESDHA